MGKVINVIKVSGEVEPFSDRKVISSLLRAGAPLDLAQKIIAEIIDNGGLDKFF